MTDLTEMTDDELIGLAFGCEMAAVMLGGLRGRGTSLARRALAGLDELAPKIIDECERRGLPEEIEAQREHDIPTSFLTKLREFVDA